MRGDVRPAIIQTVLEKSLWGGRPRVSSGAATDSNVVFGFALRRLQGPLLLLRANVRRCRNSSGERAWAAAAAAAGNARYCEDWLNHSYTALKPCSHAFLARLRRPSDASPMRPAPSPSIGRRAFRRGLKKRIANASAFRELPDAKWTRTQAPANFSPLPANTRAGNCRCHRSRREKTTRTS